MGMLSLFVNETKDLVAMIEPIIGEDDIVAVQVTLRATQTDPINWIQGFGIIEPTGKAFELREYQFWRVTDGKITERWVCFDKLGMLYQLEAVG